MSVERAWVKRRRADIAAPTAIAASASTKPSMRLGMSAGRMAGSPELTRLRFKTPSTTIVTTAARGSKSHAAMPMGIAPTNPLEVPRSGAA